MFFLLYLRSSMHGGLALVAEPVCVPISPRLSERLLALCLIYILRACARAAL